MGREPAIFTTGHSTRPIEEFLALLQGHGITCVVDVRRFPGSRRNPQYGQAALSAALAAAGLRYHPMPALGGFRRPRPDSPNSGWRNESFRGYADYMQTEEFQAALDALEQLAESERPAVMCAESVPWRCHRRLIADALVARGVPVAEITGPATAEPHVLTSFAVVRGREVVYPPG